jgi:fructokinase
MTHPEIGHMKVQPHPDDSFPGNCPYHGNCLEGLANAPALEARWHCDPAELPDKHNAWNFEAYYLAQAIHNLVLICSPKKIILGGGVLKRNGLIEKVRTETLSLINDYIQTEYLDEIDNYIVTPLLGDRAGALGAIALINS